MSKFQVFILISLGALWGASFLFMRIAAPEIGPVWLIEFRVLLAGLILLPWMLKQNYFLNMKENIGGLIIVGALNSALPFVLIAYITLAHSAGTTSILNAIVPIVGVVFSYLFVKEKLSHSQLLGVAIGFFGVVLLMLWQQEAVISPSPYAVFSAVLASLSYVAAAHYTKHYMANMPSLVFVSGTQLAAACLLLPLLPFFIPADLPSIEGIISIVGLAVLSTSLAFILYFKLIHEVGPTKTLMVTYLIPFFGMLWGTIFLNEVITLNQVVCALLILLGVALSIGSLKFFRIQRHDTSIK